MENRSPWLIVDERGHRFDKASACCMVICAASLALITHSPACFLSACHKWQIDLCEGEWNRQTNTSLHFSHTCPTVYILVPCARIAHLQFCKNHTRQTRPTHFKYAHPFFNLHLRSEPAFPLRCWPCPRQLCSYIDEIGFIVIKIVLSNLLAKSPLENHHE